MACRNDPNQHLSQTIHQPPLYQVDIFEWQPQLVAYHCIAGGYAVLSTIAYTLVWPIAGPAGDWCWTDNNSWKYFTYASLWVGFTIIAACSTYIFVLIRYVLESSFSFPIMCFPARITERTQHR